MRMFCKLGIHNWKHHVKNNVENDVEFLCRMYDRCVWCEKWGKITHFERFNK